ncbi:sugar-transfer associated ATP-grasp domain-containing protein [Winogradskyella sp. PG-2]|uniref:sugar-transfer associated ATP-grasp domain-containing protein n=1 Tax=Winogradskyella sp. PG-2 TaxID=754409 RepID=UPI0004588314|nr:sugar-transfer associated ATP-grasp domain-containing protein [Winogradskyella sp. PG-2]BAO77624.1 putative hexapeptide transferase family protein [Winogradskyella sp. PG-2]
MAIYHSIKGLFTGQVLNYQKRLVEFNAKMNSRKMIKEVLRNSNIPKLEPHEIKEAKSFYKSKGYKLNNTYWHRFYKFANGKFYKDYLPLDIFRPIMEPNLNRKLYWPALVDKNLTSNLFVGFNQPETVLSNINGFYYVNHTIVPEIIAIEVFDKIKTEFIIKPTVESGQGKMVKKFTVDNGKTSINNLDIIDLLKLYHKDFIIQKVVEQSAKLATLNSTTLNTLRVVSYLDKNGVANVLTSYLRIGKPGSDTDNISIGGMACAVKEDGSLHSKGFIHRNEGGKSNLHKAPSGILLKDYQIPNYAGVTEMVKQMHPVIPMFKFISWDIGIDKNDMPVLIEYNTFYQNIDMQMFTGPFFGKFTDEIFALGKVGK